MEIRPIEKHPRSIAKSISYRILSLSVDSVVAYLFTHDIAISAKIVLFVNTYSIIVYYVHERIWAHIHWGKANNIVQPERAIGMLPNTNERQ